MDKGARRHPSSSLVKDESYYYLDGSHEFLVGNILFRLHGSILRMHSNFFRNMCDLPQAPDKGSSKGEDDEYTVCEDAPDAFRALCWALYADPLDTGNEREITAQNIRKIAHIGLLAHKYEFPRIEQWIINICGKLPSPETLMSFQLEDLKYFAYVISQCEWEDVKEKLDDRIITGVLSEKDPSAIASASTLSNAIQIADYIHDEVLRAHAYYYYLASACWDLYPGDRQKQKSPLKMSAVEQRSAVMPLTSLSDAEKLCLFRGFSSLQTFRNRLRWFPVPEPFPDTCDATQWRSCYSTWSSWWATQWERLDPSTYMDGPLDFLREMIKKATKDPPHLPAHPNSPTKDCHVYVISQLNELKTVFGNDLPNYFKC